MIPVLCPILVVTSVFHSLPCCIFWGVVHAVKLHLFCFIKSVSVLLKCPIVFRTKTLSYLPLFLAVFYTAYLCYTHVSSSLFALVGQGAAFLCNLLNLLYLNCYNEYRVCRSYPALLGASSVIIKDRLKEGLHDRDKDKRTKNSQETSH